MKVKGLKGKEYIIEDHAIHSGREGKIFLVKGNKDIAAKIYHNGTTSLDASQKNIILANRKITGSSAKFISTPIDVLIDENGNTTGLIFPYFENIESISKQYDYIENKGINLKRNLRIVKNFCANVGAVHNAGLVIGDFNPDNFGVNPKTGIVFFMDTDSYQVVDKKGKTYRCNVCAPGYEAPELIMKYDNHIRNYPADKSYGYEKIPLPTFTVETDRHALGITIFRLLNNGVTPYSGIPSEKVKSVVFPGAGAEAIKRNNYCFGPNKTPHLCIVPTKGSHPPYIENLFERCFEEGYYNPSRRPTEYEWYEACNNYEKELVVCKQDKDHSYWKNLKTCPWCEANERFSNSEAGNKPVSVKSAPVAPAPAVSKPVATNTVAVASTSATSVPGTSAAPSPTPTTSVTSMGCSTTNNKPLKSNWINKEYLKKFASILGWGAFLFSVVYALAPFVSNGSIHFNDDTLASIDLKSKIIAVLVGMGLLSFGSRLSGEFELLADCLSYLWGFVFILFSTCSFFLKTGANSASTGPAWRFLGILTVFYITIMLISRIIGSEIRENICWKLKFDSIKSVELKNFIFVGCLFGLTTCGIRMLMYPDRLFTFFEQHNLFIIGVIFTSLVVVINYLYESNSYLADDWVFSYSFCSTAIFMLYATHIGGFKGMCIIVLIAIYCIGICAIAIDKLDSLFSDAVKAFFPIIIISGIYMLCTYKSGGLNAIGVGAWWWLRAPVVIGLIISTLDTLMELFVERVRN